jgi:hypothetical protein
MPVRAGDLIAPNSKLLASPWALRSTARRRNRRTFSEVATCADDLCLIRSIHRWPGSWAGGLKLPPDTKRNPSQHGRVDHYGLNRSKTSRLCHDQSLGF